MLTSVVLHDIMYFLHALVTSSGNILYFSDGSRISCNHSNFWTSGMEDLVRHFTELGTSVHQGRIQDFSREVGCQPRLGSRCPTWTFFGENVCETRVGWSDGGGGI